LSQEELLAVALMTMSVELQEVVVQVVIALL
jgi:hypothetical protein